VTLVWAANMTLGYEGGSQQPYLVPTGVSSLSITAIGGGGGRVSGGGNGGFGAQLTGTFAVVPGDRVLVVVAGLGQSGSNYGKTAGGGAGGDARNGGKGGTNYGASYAYGGGGGGGASVVKIQHAIGTVTTLMIAGGGDGGGSKDSSNTGGNAGVNVSSDGLSATGGHGGANGSCTAGAAGRTGNGLGQTGFDNSYFNVAGGGGGGGVAGGWRGDAGDGCAAGGGAGSSTFDPSVVSPQFSIAPSSMSGANGQVTLTAASYRAGAVEVIDLPDGWHQVVPLGGWSAPFSVNVADTYGTPLPNIKVTFTIGDPSLALFPGSQPSVTVTTDATGTATAPGFLATSWKSGLPGHWNFDVTASSGGKSRVGSFTVTVR
jgi:hypothetical protein